MASPFDSISTGLFDNLLVGAFGILAALILMSIILVIGFYVRYKRQFNIIVELYSERSDDVRSSNFKELLDRGNYKLIFDKAGILYDKSDKSWYCRILGEKVDLPVPPFDVLTPSNKGNVLKVWQKSNEEYVFLHPDNIRTSVIRRQDGSLHNISEVSNTQVEGDISFWNIKRKEKNRALFDTESIIWKLLPILVPVMTGMIMIFLIWVVLDKFSVLADVASTLKDVALALRDASQQTVVVTESG